MGGSGLDSTFYIRSLDDNAGTMQMNKFNEVLRVLDW